MADSDCRECKRFTVKIYDSGCGDVICGECGLVLEARLIDEGQEWRTFSDTGSSQGGARAERANPHEELETRIVRQDGKCGLDSRGHRPFLPREHENSESRGKREVFTAVARVADVIGLNNDSVVFDTKTMAVECLSSLTRHRYDKVEIAAACMYHCCKMQGVPVQPQDFIRAIDSASADGRGRKKSVHRKSTESRFSACYKAATSSSNTKNVFIRGENYVNMYGSMLGLERRQTAKVKDLYDKVKDATVGGGSVLNAVAACLVHVARIAHESSPIEQRAVLGRVSQVTGIGRDTISKTLRDLAEKLTQTM